MQARQIQRIHAFASLRAARDAELRSVDSMPVTDCVPHMDEWLRAGILSRALSSDEVIRVMVQYADGDGVVAPASRANRDRCTDACRARVRVQLNDAHLNVEDAWLQPWLIPHQVVKPGNRRMRHHEWTLIRRNLTVGDVVMRIETYSYDDRHVGKLLRVVHVGELALERGHAYDFSYELVEPIMCRRADCGCDAHSPTCSERGPFHCSWTSIDMLAYMRATWEWRLAAHALLIGDDPATGLPSVVVNVVLMFVLPAPVSAVNADGGARDSRDCVVSLLV
jgi:hypothetical protein